MSFTNQKPQVVTKESIKQINRCYLCGEPLHVGEYYRWVYMGGQGVVNFITCEECDGDDVKERFIVMNKEFKKRFWWTLQEVE